MLPHTDPFKSVPPELRTALEQRGFSRLTVVQQAVLVAEAAGRNLRISSQTGSGKTVALGLALASELIEHLHAEPKRRSGPLALVITPTRELAHQVRDELAWLYAEVRGLDVLSVTGGTNVGTEQRALARRPRLLVGTPGRLLDHLRSGAFDCSGVRHVVLDEADQMLDMGFREELDAIVEQLPAERRSHLVSATFPAEVRQLADRFQGDALQLAGTYLGEAHSDIEHVAHLVRPSERYAALVNVLLLVHGERTLIFVRQRTDAAELSEQLAADGFSALPLSGDLAQAQRTRTLNAFRTGIVKTLVATDVASRGIDVADISTVIHVHMPTDPNIYTHRSGRTGRAGKKGRSLLLVPYPSQKRVEAVLRGAKVDAQWRSALTPKEVMRTLKKRFRRQLHALLGVVEEPPDDARGAYAAELLSRFEAPLLVGRLLALAEPELPREPMAISAVDPAPVPSRSRSPRQGPPKRPFAAAKRPGPRGARPPRPANAGPRRRPRGEGK